MSTQLAPPILTEFQLEAASTRRLLERVPGDKLDWQPHEKSMTLGRLASHVAEIPHWGRPIVNTPELDLATSDYKPEVATDLDGLLAMHDKIAQDFVEAVSSKEDDELLEKWKLLSGDHVIVDMPRINVLRSFIMSHLVHHRGQLTVYLRMLDVPLPGIYGPSADDDGMGS